MGRLLKAEIRGRDQKSKRPESGGIRALFFLPVFSMTEREKYYANCAKFFVLMIKGLENIFRGRA
jgi:hypothetical protein